MSGFGVHVIWYIVLSFPSYILLLNTLNSIGILCYISLQNFPLKNVLPWRFCFLTIFYNFVSYVKVGLSRLSVPGTVLIYYICLEIIFFFLGFKFYLQSAILLLKKKKFFLCFFGCFPIWRFLVCTGCFLPIPPPFFLN